MLAGKLVEAVERDGARVEPKDKSIHLCRKTAFAGIHPRKSAVLLNIRSAAPIDSPRIRKVERVSANRYHNEMLLTEAADLDEQLRGWLADAAELTS